MEDEEGEERRAGEEDVQEEEGQEERKDVRKERKSHNEKELDGSWI